MGMSSLTFSQQFNGQASCQNNLTPGAAGPIVNASSPSVRYSYGTAAANAAVGGSNEAALFITSVAGSGSATIDFTSVTDLLNTAAVSLARIKAIWFCLLSAALDSVNGTAATSVTLGNNSGNDWISQSHTGWLASAASVMDVPNGGSVGFCTSSAGGILVDNTHKIEKVTNNDTVVAAKLQTFLCGGDS